MKKKLVVIILMSLALLVGCKKEETKKEDIKLLDIYHYSESYQDTLYITYESKEEIKDIKLISKDNNEYKDSYNNELDFIKEKVMLFYVGKEDYKNGKLKLEIETEKEKKIYTLENIKEYTSIEELRGGYTFQGWSTSSCSGSVNYAAGANYTSNLAATMYAIWKSSSCTVTRTLTAPTNGTVTATWTATYNCNGSTGTIATCNYSGTAGGRTYSNVSCNDGTYGYDPTYMYVLGKTKREYLSAACHTSLGTWFAYSGGMSKTISCSCN